jgi:hypothetical protein
VSISPQRLENALKAERDWRNTNEVTKGFLHAILTADDAYRASHTDMPESEPPENTKVFRRDDQLWVDNGMCWSFLPQIPAWVFLAAYRFRLEESRAAEREAAVEVTDAMVKAYYDADTNHLLNEPVYAAIKFRLQAALDAQRKGTK